MCSIEPIIMSAGELESEWAGAPGRLIRDRYRRAAEVAKVRGKLPCLMINDLDAGVGIQEGVQRTVSAAVLKATECRKVPEHHISFICASYSFRYVRFWAPGGVLGTRSLCTITAVQSLLL